MAREIHIIRFGMGRTPYVVRATAGGPSSYGPAGCSPSSVQPQTSVESFTTAYRLLSSAHLRHALMSNAIFAINGCSIM
jgi:hypothetical protein